MRERSSARVSAVLSIGILSFLLAGSDASAAPKLIEQFRLPVGPSVPIQIAPGSGHMWVIYRQHPPQRGPVTINIGQISLSGSISEFMLPHGANDLDAITEGPDGNLWFAEQQAIGRINASGEVAYFATGSEPLDISDGPEESLWFIGTTGSVARKPTTLGRVTEAGVVSEIPLPEAARSTGRIAASKNGGVWLLQSSPAALGRLDSDGSMAEFPLPSRERTPRDVTEGPEGDMWFTEGGGGEGGFIGHLSQSGAIREFPIGEKEVWGEEITESNGRLWFSEGYSGIGSITPRGNVSHIKQWSPTGVVTGPEGNVWFATDTIGPCLGGGGACEIAEEEATEPGIFGRVLPAPLYVEVQGKVRRKRRHLRVRVRCGGGEGSSVCSGRIRATTAVGPRSSKQSASRTVVLGSVAYTLSADEEAALPVRLSSRALRLFSNRRRLNVAIRVTASGAQTAERKSHFTDHPSPVSLPRQVRRERD